MNVNVLTGVSSDVFNTQNAAATQQSNSAESFDNILATAMNMVKETNNYQKRKLNLHWENRPIPMNCLWHRKRQTLHYPIQLQ